MTDCAIDACVAVKWIVSEADSLLADQVAIDVSARGGRVLLLDCAVAEVANALWVYHRKGLMTAAEVEAALLRFLGIPSVVVPFRTIALETIRIAIQHKIAVYDAGFVAVAQQFAKEGATSDSPLHKATAADFPNIRLLKDW